MISKVVASSPPNVFIFPRWTGKSDKGRENEKPIQQQVFQQLRENASLLGAYPTVRPWHVIPEKYSNQRLVILTDSRAVPEDVFLAAPAVPYDEGEREEQYKSHKNRPTYWTKDGTVGVSTKHIERVNLLLGYGSKVLEVVKATLASSTQQFQRIVIQDMSFEKFCCKWARASSCKGCFAKQEYQ